MSFGRLERPRSAQPISEINVTPLVDVMLVLVVIFILTAPLLTSAIKLDLPQSAAAKPAQASRALTLVVDRAGQIFLADQPITPERLAQQLRQAAQANPDTEGKPIERMIPFVNAYVDQVDLAARQILVDWQADY